MPDGDPRIDPQGDEDEFCGKCFEDETFAEVDDGDEGEE
jgi:hypothetical protein